MPKHIESSSILACLIPTHKKFKDIAGLRVERLVVVGFAGKRTTRHGKDYFFWSCVCDCGTTLIQRGCRLRSGMVKSCGCLHLGEKRGRAITHGMYGTVENRLWRVMWNRCRNPKERSWKHYGGRGITVCERWKKFENFFADMGFRPSPKHTIERRENNEGYSPDNCFWATQTQQQRNRRNNHVITIDGKTMCLAAWIEELGVSGTMVRSRLGRGWSEREALFEPRRAWHIVCS